MEKYTRQPVKFNDKTIEFQSLEWLDFNTQVNENESDSDNCEYEQPKNELYEIKCFGVTLEGYTVCMTITDFMPFFYIEVPDTFSKSRVNTFLNNLCEVTGYYNGRPYSSLKSWSRYLLRDKCILQRRKKFWGYQENECSFVRLTFSNSEAQRRFKYTIKNHNDPENKCRIKGMDSQIHLFEDNLDPILRFIHIRDLQASGWLSAKNISICSGGVRNSTCQIEVRCKWTDVSNLNKNGNGRILQAGFDIETFSVDGSFPKPEIKGNVITQIGTVFKWSDSPPNTFFLKHIICLKTCAPIDEPDTIVESYQTEKEVLIAWRNLLIKTDPDILLSYNGDMFDCNYINIRSKVTKCSEQFLKGIGKLRNISGAPTEKTFSSSAYGTSNYVRLSFPGRLNFDIMIFIQREYKENSYKLDNIAEKYLGDKKHDVDHHMIFDYFASGDPEKIKKIGLYCLQDCALLPRLVDTLYILQHQISMSNVTYVPFRYLIERGQQIKAFSQILKLSRKMNYIVPSFFGEYKETHRNGGEDNTHSDGDEEEFDESRFKGATVLDPTRGAYLSPVTVFDYKSLYPSIMIAHNLCYSTILMDNTHLNYPSDSWCSFEWTDEFPSKNDKKVMVKVPHTFYYMKKEVKDGLLPIILRELTLSREKAKKEMKIASKNGDSVLKEIFNKQQLAYKISMNSVYGFLAAQMLTLKPIAATVTYIGRTMIDGAKKWIEENYSHYGAECIYGDSVLGSTVLVLRDPKTNWISIKTIEQLSIGTNSYSYDNFKLDGTLRSHKSYTLTNYQIWTDVGWSNIKRVIKHKTNKKIFRVVNNNGWCDVTEDHSLLDSQLNPIKPEQINGDTVLANTFINEFNKDKTNISSSLAYKMGYKCILDPVINGSIINSPKNIRASFYKGYLKNCNIKQVKSQVWWQGIYYIQKSLGFNNCISKSDSPFVNTNLKCSNDETSIQELEMSSIDGDFVYDLETECGRFCAGVGSLLLKNTDSVFLKFETALVKKYLSEFDRINSQVVITDISKKRLADLKAECIQESINIGKEISPKINSALYKEPVSLEYEKVYGFLFLLSKKRYIGDLYEKNPDKREYQDSKGIVLKRRDNFPITKIIYQKVIDLLSTKWKKGLPEVKQLIIDLINDMKYNRIDLKDLIMTKTYKPPYKSQNLPHVALVRKITERGEDEIPKSNDRISYVIIDNGNFKKEPLYLKSELASYKIANNLPLDIEYYIEYISKPLCEVIDLFIPNAKQFFKEPLIDYKKDKLKKAKNSGLVTEKEAATILKRLDTIRVVKQKK